MFLIRIGFSDCKRIISDNSQFAIRHSNWNLMPNKLHSIPVMFRCFSSFTFFSLEKNNININLNLPSSNQDMSLCPYQVLSFIKIKSVQVLSPIAKKCFTGQQIYDSLWCAIDCTVTLSIKNGGFYLLIVFQLFINASLLIICPWHLCIISLFYNNNKQMRNFLILQLRTNLCTCFGVTHPTIKESHGETIISWLPYHYYV